MCALSDIESHHLLRALMRNNTANTHTNNHSNESKHSTKATKVDSVEVLVCEDYDLIVNTPCQIEREIVQLCRGCCLGLRVAAGAILVSGMCVPLPTYPFTYGH